MAKDFFQKHNVAYEEVDVTTDDSLIEEMVQKSHQMGVPVIEINGEIFVGFDREGLSRALKIS